MTDYNSYRLSKNLTNRDIISCVRSKYPSYGKMQNSVVNNPERNGVCLLPEAEKLLIQKFGYGPGLLARRPSARNHGNKDKPNRYSVRLSTELSQRVEQVMDYLCFTSKQDFIEAAIVQMCDRYGGK